ncbi:MAG: hypothetical protein ACO29Q_05450 [Crocinitomicaceae bacterium]|jgi:hypothetical protein
MKIILFSLTLFVLFSCTKETEPQLSLTVTQNSTGQFVLTANIDNIDIKKLNFCGFSGSVIPDHDISSSQIRTTEITGNTVVMTMDNYNFPPGQTYYFTCFVGTKNGKLVRSEPVSLTGTTTAPCFVANNSYSVASAWDGSIIENGNTSNAVFTGTTGGGVYRQYSVQLGFNVYKFKFLGEPSTQIYTSMSSSTNLASSHVYIQNTSSGYALDFGNSLYVKNNNDGTFTMTMCAGSGYDYAYTPANVTYTFKITGNY